MSPLARRPWQVLPWFLFVPLACDAFVPPDPPPEPIELPLPPPAFCPSTEFARVSPGAALAGPLFVWLTLEERQLIETGGPILPAVPSSQPSAQERLVAVAHDALRGASPSSVRASLAGQPRVGRGFWPFAFSAPRASAAHDQLLAIWLRPDAWLARFAPSDFAVVDAADLGQVPTAAALTPGRIAGLDTQLVTDCLRDGSIERTFVVFREEAIERWRFGPEAEDQLEAEIVSLEALLAQLRRESELNPDQAFTGLSCGASLSPSLCPADTYFQAVAWASPTYLPTISALAALIDQLANLERTAHAGADLLDAGGATWPAVWPGPWHSPGTGGGDGTGGASETGGTGPGGAGGLGGSEG